MFFNYLFNNMTKHKYQIPAQRIFQKFSILFKSFSYYKSLCFQLFSVNLQVEIKNKSTLFDLLPIINLF